MKWLRPNVALLLATSACWAMPAACAAPVSAGSGPAVATALESGIDAFIRREMETRKIPGLAFGIVREGRLVLSKGYGFADLERRQPVTAATRFQAASITKTFTAVAVMKLVERGRVRLDQPIGTYLPDLPRAWRGATVEQLLRHTSGISSYTAHDVPPCGRPKAEPDYRTRDVIAEVSCLPLDFAPGTDWAYSDTGYLLLGLLIEARSRMEYGAFLRSVLFDPLGMSETSLLAADGTATGRAKGYIWRADRYQAGPPLYPAIEFAGGGMVTTVGDLARWDSGMRPGVLLSERSWRLLLAPTPTGKAMYGMGFGLRPVDAHRQVGHTGGGPAAATSFARFIDDGFTVIVLANASSPSSGIQQVVAGIASRFRAQAKAKAKPKPRGIAASPRPTREVVLEDDALRVVETASGSSQRLGFGTDERTVVRELTRALPGVQDSTDGSGDCTNNTVYLRDADLVLHFSEGTFAGWYLGKRGKLRTAAGYGVGSTRADLEAVADPGVGDEGLGLEFVAGSIVGGLESEAPDAKITDLRSGDTCVMG